MTTPATPSGSALDRDRWFIAVEGPIGVGKTTLTRRIAESLGCETLLEPSISNPFLERFYTEGRQHALPTQLHFLLHRMEQLRALRQADLFRTSFVADYLMDKDRLFARLTLDEIELALYEQVHAQLAIPTPVPDLVVYLQAPTPVLQERISRRGIASEQNIGADYLDRLNAAYTSLFHYYDAAPVLIVNAADIDLVHDQPVFEALLEEIRQRPAGPRRYFNPQPSLL